MPHNTLSCGKFKQSSPEYTSFEKDDVKYYDYPQSVRYQPSQQVQSQPLQQVQSQPQQVQYQPLPPQQQMQSSKKFGGLLGFILMVFLFVIFFSLLFYFIYTQSARFSYSADATNLISTTDFNWFAAVGWSFLWGIFFSLFVYLPVILAS